MKRVLFFPLWKVEKLENILHQCEFDGWRLKNVRCSCLFDFSATESKDVDYILTYNMTRDGTPCMYEYERKLLSEYSANKVETKFTGYNLYRIVGRNRDFTDLKKYRKKYFRHVLFQQMLISFVFFAISSLILLATILQNVQNVCRVFAGVFVFIAGILFLYRAYGYIRQANVR